MSFTFLLYFAIISSVSAFGAGNIPSYGALEGLSFRHGDIEDVLLQLAMVPISEHFLSSLNPLSSHGKKFNAMAVKRVYFGNWLRDFSQAIDVGTLSKGLDIKTIRLLVWMMAFMDFGYATEEFEVTEDRLGVYRAEEHIDNPKGYPSPEEPDARKFDRRLRGPVDPRELDIDPRTGMKNYIANENGDWMTSSSYVRNSLLHSIDLGRSYKQTGDQAAKYESLRILGQALHTLEDFTAHSNFCELTLVQLGYTEVFCQVGTATRINLNNQEVFPLTTGTFGGLDFVHSLLGEATDKISQTQLTEVSAGLASSSSQGSLGILTGIQSLLNKLPGATPISRDLAEMEKVSVAADQLRAQNQMDTRDGGRFPASINTDADEIARQIYPILAFRDRLMKGLSAFLEKIPGLNALIDKISEALTVWVLSTVEPFLKPIIEKITGALGAGQALVTSGEAQLEVFDDPSSSDPTHSMLAKDHFTCYLNQPAGLVAQAVVKHAVHRVVAAWADPSVDSQVVVAEILEVFHHPANIQGRTSIQSEMQNIVRGWVDSLGNKHQKIMHGLTMDGVRNGLHHEGGTALTTGVQSNHSHKRPGQVQTGLGTSDAMYDVNAYTSHGTDASVIGGFPEAPNIHGHRMDLSGHQNNSVRPDKHGHHSNTARPQPLQQNYSKQNPMSSSSLLENHRPDQHATQQGGVQHDGHDAYHSSVNSYQQYTQTTTPGNYGQTPPSQQYGDSDYVQQGYGQQLYGRQDLGYAEQGQQSYEQQNYAEQNYGQFSAGQQNNGPQNNTEQGYHQRVRPQSNHQTYGNSSDWSQPQS